jgi:hypothetical protein
LPRIRHFDTYKEVAQHILAMDDKLCTETFLINLITYIPNRNDDLTTMKKYLEGPLEECQKLDLPEQFTIEVSQIFLFDTFLKNLLT